MTRAMRAVAPAHPGPRALRLGVVRDGCIEEERLLREPAAFTVGPDEGSGFLLREPGLAGPTRLFDREGDGWALCFTDGMTGRLSQGGAPVELDALRGMGPVHRVALHPSARGKVRIGSTTILFQLVVPPPVTPRPQLPASVRGGLLSQIDWPFTSTAVAVLTGFFGFLVALENADWPVQTALAAIDTQAFEPLFAEPEPPPDRDALEPLDNPDAVPEAPTETASTDTGPRHNTGPHSNRPVMVDRDPTPTLTADQIAAMAHQEIIGTLGDGSLADNLRPGADFSNARDVLDQADAVCSGCPENQDTIRPRGDREGHPTGPLSGLRGTHSGPADEGPGPVEIDVVPPRVHPLPPQRPPYVPEDIAMRVARAVRGRTRQIQACYEHRLGGNADLEGRVSVAFTVMPVGSVSGMHVTQNTSGNPGLGACVTDALGSLRINPGPDEPLPFSFPFIFTPQQQR